MKNSQHKGKCILLSLVLLELNNFCFNMFQAEAITLPVDSRITMKIKDLAQNNITRVGEVQRHVEMFVRNDLFPGKQVPSITNRRFHPSRRDIGSMIYIARRQLLKSRCDLENLEAKIEDWKQMYPDDKFFFRSKNSDDNKTDDVPDNIKLMDGKGKTGCLFVCQSKQQCRLLEKYGQDVIQLDATYRTTKYAIPFFQLCITTNIDYQPVAIFVCEFEDSATILEPLQIICDWNPLWKPKHFMVDFAESEINAIEQLFPGAVQ